MEELKRLRLQVKIMANTIDTQEKIIEELRRVLPQAHGIRNATDFIVRKTYPKAAGNTGENRYIVDNCYVRFEIETDKKLPPEFDAELMKLVYRYSS